MKDIKELLNFGLINFDKPAGPTSYSVSEFVKRQLGLKKTSHMGTLDPKVTGVLPITLGRACKLAGYFIRHDKTYVGVLETHKECRLEDLQKLIDDNFTGKIKQTPPHRSAVKVAERERTVYFWKLLEASEDGRYFLFETKCEGGTYIRKLCSDLGEMIGGAHMGELRRTEAGIFGEKDVVKLDDFEVAVMEWKNGDDAKLREMVVPAEVAIREVLPCVDVDKSAVKSLYIGRPLFANNVKKVRGLELGVGGGELKEGDFFAAFVKDVFIGIYRRTSEEIIFARSEFVFN
ncbi:RNA-guided pseudouridylation complex pseudouridine synthase subunit Cbf5 [archaeon]|nr:RNA-guided pseudouridylation complex pseudouridine synthase subunit Cbf5 [archaeon]MBT7128796.1 RNA-guided pseudouridylation complex pseudouridine synthase subunit Cbf5 [archaeon]